METPVELWVYDLSGGIAARASKQLTGTQIDGIWHTSVVVFGMEIFYGQGISIVQPGTSHHGQPLRKLPMGGTQLEKDLIMNYIDELRALYTADKYHILDFNCNNFTNDVVAFMTGNSIPQDIIDLPKVFLSTPFGQQLLPMINNVFGQGNGTSLSGVQAESAFSNVNVNNNNVNQISPGINTGGSSSSTQSSSMSMKSALSICTNVPSFESILESNACTVAMFTSESCPPCKVIKPVFEDLAVRYSSDSYDPTTGSASQKDALSLPMGSRAVSHQIRKIAFVLVDAQIGQSVLASRSIRATPTFQYFRGKNMVHETKGGNRTELENQVEFLLCETYTPHVHTKKRYDTLAKVCKDPIKFDTPPNMDALLKKLDESLKQNIGNDNEQDLNKLKDQIIPKLKASSTATTKMSVELIDEWIKLSQQLIGILPAGERFPIVDLLRLGLLSFNDQTIGNRLAQSDYLPKIIQAIDPKTDDKNDSKPMMITTLRFLANSFYIPILAIRAGEVAFASDQDNINDKQVGIMVVNILIHGLLHSEPSVRTSASSLAYVFTRWVSGSRPVYINGHGSTHFLGDESEEWVADMASALIDCLSKEKEFAVVQRIIAALGSLIYLSPHYVTLCTIAESMELEKCLLDLRKDLFSKDSALVDEVISLYSTL